MVRKAAAEMGSVSRVGSVGNGHAFDIEELGQGPA